MSLQYGFRAVSNTIAGITPEMCEAIIAEYADEVIRSPCTTDQWKAVRDLVCLSVEFLLHDYRRHDGDVRLALVVQETARQRQNTL